MTNISPAPTREPISGGGISGEKPVMFSGIWSSWFSGIVKAVNELLSHVVPIRASAINETLNPDTDEVLLMSAATGNKTVALPTYTKVKTGRRFCVKKTDATANTVVISAPDAKTIDGVANYTLAAAQAKVWIISDGSNWQTI